MWFEHTLRFATKEQLQRAESVLRDLKLESFSFHNVSFHTYGFDTLAFLTREELASPVCTAILSAVELVETSFNRDLDQEDVTLHIHSLYYHDQSSAEAVATYLRSEHEIVDVLPTHNGGYSYVVAFSTEQALTNQECESLKQACQPDAVGLNHSLAEMGVIDEHYTPQ